MVEFVRRLRFRRYGLAVAVSFQEALQRREFSCSSSLDGSTVQEFATQTVGRMMHHLEITSFLAAHFREYVSRLGGTPQFLAAPISTYDVLFYVSPLPLALAYIRDASLSFPDYKFLPVVGITPENFFAALFDAE